MPLHFSPSPSPLGRPPTSPQGRSWGRLFWWTGGVGIALLAVAGPEGLSRPLLQLALPLLLIAGLVCWRVRRWRQRAEKGHSGPYWINVAKKMWRPRGSGFYALVAAVTFVGLQGELLFDRSREIWGTWRDAPYTDGGAFVDFLSSQLWGGFMEVLVAVSLETVLNVVWAGLWPLFWLQRYGVVVAVGAVLFIYAGYRIARRRSPGFNAVMQQVDVDKGADWSRDSSIDEPEREPNPSSTRFS